jgi:allantoinase
LIFVRGGIVPTNHGELATMAEEGICGFKCFLIDSGVEEFPCVNKGELQRAMEILVQNSNNLPVLVHAEQCNTHEHGHAPDSDHFCAKLINQPRNYENYLQSRPEKFEEDAIESAISLATITGCRTHIVHLSAATAIKQFEAARVQNLSQITVETCPHYLTLDAQTIPEGATQFKCAPPIRDKANQADLWAALHQNVINFIVSDHSPCEPKRKLLAEGNFHGSWGGISSLQLALPLIFTELKQQSEEKGAENNGKPDNSENQLGIIVNQINQWMSYRPAQFVQFLHRKGSLEVGKDADLCIWNPSQTIEIQPQALYFKHKVTPYMGKVLYGKVERSFVRGNQVYHHKQESFKEPKGKQIVPASCNNQL